MARSTARTVGQWLGALAALTSFGLGGYMFVFGSLIEVGNTYEVVAGYEYLQGNGHAGGAFIAAILAVVVGLAIGYGIWRDRLPLLWLLTVVLFIGSFAVIENGVFVLVTLFPLFLSAAALSADRYVHPPSSPEVG